MKYEVWSWYLLGALLGAAVTMAGTTVVLSHIEAKTPIAVACPEVTPKGEPLEAPESPVEAPKVQKVLGAIEEQDEGVVPTSPRRQKRRRPERPRMDINLESDDPLEGI